MRQMDINIILCLVCAVRSPETATSRSAGWCTTVDSRQPPVSWLVHSHSRDRCENKKTYQHDFSPMYVLYFEEQQRGDVRVCLWSSHCVPGTLFGYIRGRTGRRTRNEKNEGAHQVDPKWTGAGSFAGHPPARSTAVNASRNISNRTYSFVGLRTAHCLSIVLLAAGRVSDRFGDPHIQGVYIIACMIVEE